MIKHFFLALMAIFFPWLVLFLEDNPGGALVALIMQASIIGWLPASLWAWRTARANQPKNNIPNNKIK